MQRHLLDVEGFLQRISAMQTEMKEKRRAQAELGEAVRAPGAERC